MKLITAITLLLVCCSFAKPMLTINGNAHRLLNKRDSQKAFVIEIDTTSNTRSLVRLALTGRYTLREPDSRSLRIQGGNVSVKAAELTGNQVQVAKRLAGKLLPGYLANQFHYLSTDTETETNAETGTSENSGYIFNFQRVYNGRVVRSAGDYLTIVMEASGTMRYAEISMSDLRATLEYIETTETQGENIAALDSVVNFTFTDSQANVVGVSATGAAKSYCMVDDNSRVVLHPCISYTVKVELDNGETVNTIIDAPHSLRAWIEYKHGKRASVQYASNSLGDFIR